MAKRIIIAEDDENARNTLADLILECTADVEIVTVSNGKDLLDKVRADNYSLVFTDYEMPPGITGIEAIKQIRSFNPTIPIYMISGGGVKKEAMEVGATDYIKKTERYTKKLVEILNKHLK